MKQILLIGIGGGLGAIIRYQLTHLVQNPLHEGKFPVGTLMVNLIGCFVIGVLSSIGDRTPWLGADSRLLLMTGILGGFTTFSAFGLETIQLLKRGEGSLAITYVLLSVLFGLLFVLLGQKISDLLFK